MVAPEVFVQRKFIYVLIRCVQTNVNYFLLKYYRNTTPKEWRLDAQAVQADITEYIWRKNITVNVP